MEFNDLNACVIIPARFRSSRFPGKPMAKINGMPMVEIVYENVKKCKMLDEVFVATCDHIIYEHILKIGGKAIMTSNKHNRCTSRCAEALKKIEKIYNKKVGDVVKKGDLIGYVGNTGTRYGALNNLLGAHLHWEIHFENESNKYYLGQNITNEDFLKLSNKLFEGEGYEEN